MTPEIPSRAQPSTSESRADAADRAEAPSELTEFVEELPPVPSARRRQQKLVLVGAGHTHLQLLNLWRERPLRGVELTLISAFPHAVAGHLLPSVLANIIPAREMLIDLAAMARRCRAEFVIDKVVGLDPETRTLDLALYPERNFDVASINIGAVNSREDLCQTHRVIVGVKPHATFLSRFDHRLQELLLQFREAPTAEYLQLAVVGGGETGVELALCLEERAHREGWHVEVRLIESQPEILAGFSPRAVRLVQKLCQKRRIPIHTGSPVVDCDEDGPPVLILENGESIRADLVIWAAGAAPPALLNGYPLPRTAAGYLAVRPTLRTTADWPVFAAGEIAEIVGGPPRRASAPEASILWLNLRRWFRGGRLKTVPMSPQSQTLLSCGDGTAIWSSGRWAVRSSWIWRWKRFLARREMRRFE